MDKRRFFSRLYFVLLTCLLILPCSKDVSGADWMPYFKGDNLSYFYDAQGISFLPNNIIRVWTKCIPKSEEDRVQYIHNIRKMAPNISDNWSSSQVLYEINCKNRTFTVIQVYEYDTEDNVITIASIKGPPISDISPDTMMEDLYKIVCPKKDPKKKGR
jgi:hypothetical protein